MASFLEFPQPQTLPSLRSSPYVIFGILGGDVTPSLPPYIPLYLVLHFIPVLRKWVLPAPEIEYLPHIDAHQTLCTPYVGIDIQAPVDVVGLRWIIAHVIHLGGRITPKETFGVSLDFPTSIAIHNAWLALELPLEGLRGLHMNVQAQLLLCSGVSLGDMRILWNTFPHDSTIIKTMGMNFADAIANMGYGKREAFAICQWFHSTPELEAFFSNLKVPSLSAIERSPHDPPKRKISSGWKTVGKRGTRKVTFQQVNMLERNTTRKASSEEKQARQENEVAAMEASLSRASSIDSLRSVDAVIWDHQNDNSG